jgi:hypothetical protein
MKLNLGCGQVRPLGWWNGDSSFNSLLQKYGIMLRSTKYSAPAEYIDLRKPWPFKSGSVQVLYASHLFEHLNEFEASYFLEEAARVLARGAVIRIVVPDMNALAREYVEQYDKGNAEAAKSFLYAMNLHQTGTYPKPAFGFRYLIGLLQGFPHQHKYMYDPVSLMARLTDAGFNQLHFASYGHSEYLKDIKDVECTSEGVPSIYIEGRI